MVCGSFGGQTKVWIDFLYCERPALIWDARHSGTPRCDNLFALVMEARSLWMDRDSAGRRRGR